MALPTISAAHDAVAGGSEVLNRLRGAFMLATKSNSKTIFYTRSRVKDPNSLIEKLFDRQSRYDEPYSLNDVTDLIGYRLVVLYDDQLEAAFRLAIQVLKNCHHAQDPLISDPELWADIHEIKFFPRSYNTDDPYAVLHDKLTGDPGIVGRTDADLTRRIQKADPVGAPNSKSAYSSMHVILHVNSYSAGPQKRLPLELQIRTAVEDIWSEMSHENEYKIRKRNAWSPALKRLYQDNEDDVRTLKQQLNSLVPEKVARIRRTTKEVTEELAKLRAVPQAQYNSYVLNLAFHIGMTFFDTRQRGLFDHYGGRIDAIRTAYNDQARPTRTADLLHEFELAREALGNVAKITLAEAQCQSNFRRLIELEEVRLDAIRIRLIMRGAAVTEAEKSVLTAQANRLYEKLDEIESDAALLIKPVAMIQFFKYYVARYGSQAIVAADHLNACYSALKVDPTVNPDGMMVVMATRAFAQTFWENAENYRTNATKSLFGAQEMRDRYERALSLAIESRATYERRDRKATPTDQVDDLIFGTSPFQEHTCMNNVVMYAADGLLNGISPHAMPALGYSVDALESDVGKLREFLSGPAQGLEDIWHTAMLGSEALARCGHGAAHRDNASTIATQLRNSANKSSMPKRVQEDICRILDGPSSEPDA